MAEEVEQEVVGDDAFELTSAFSFSLNQRILPNGATSARVEPDAKETLVAVSASNKVILRSESFHLKFAVKFIRLMVGLSLLRRSDISIDKLTFE